MNQVKTRLLLVICAACLLLAVSASATVWNVVGAFSETSNPSGDWKYWSWFSGAMTASGTYQADDNIGGWWKNVDSTTPYVLKTRTGAEYVAGGVRFLPDELTMKSAGGDWSIVTWTCPADGNYYWKFEYTGREENGSTHVQAYSNYYGNWDGGWIGYGQATGFDVPVAASPTQMLFLPAGSTFDFYIEGSAVGLKGYFTDDPTMIPEPSALVVLCSGLVGICSVAVRRKRGQAS